MKQVAQSVLTSTGDHTPLDDHEAVKHCIDQAIGWAIEKDFEGMFRLWADDLFHYWVFSNSTVIGLDAFKRYAEVWRDPDFRGTRYEFRDLRIRFSRSGDVAWYSTHLDDYATIKGEEHCMKNVFQTGVLEKRDGHWVHVQMHGSYPVDKIPENLLHQFYAARFANSKTEKETNVPNQSADSTAFAGTPAAEQPRVPTSAASHL